MVETAVRVRSHQNIKGTSGAFLCFTAMQPTQADRSNRAILDEQVEAALTVWFEPQWPTLVQLGTVAAPAYAALVTESREKMRRALIAARKAAG